MAAILGLDADTGRAGVRARPPQGEVVSPANLNGGGQVVIAGARDAVARARRARQGARRQARRSAAGQRAVPLRADEAGRGSPGAGAARARRAHDPRVPIVANVDAEPKRDRAARDRGARSRRCRRRCGGKRSCERLASEGVTTYVEVGPGTVLSGLVRKIHRDATVVSFGSPGRSGGGRTALA